MQSNEESSNESVQSNEDYVDRNFRDLRDSESNDEDEDIPFSKLKNILQNDDELNLNFSTSIADVLLMGLKFAETHNLSQTAITDHFKMVNIIFGQKIAPDTRYLIDTLFNYKKRLEFHAICPQCKCYIDQFNCNDRQVICFECNETVNLKNPTYRDYFVILNFENDISSLIRQNINYYDDVINQRMRNRETLNDITDGRLYKRFLRSLPRNDRVNSITATFNTDGAPVFESSKLSVWPIQLIINELPVKVRNCNPVLCGLWFGKDKPVMNIFLKPFVSKMNRLSNQGISFIVNNEVRRIKVYCVCSCVDSVARAPMQGLVQFNGYYGCNWCMHPGVYVPTARGGAIKYVLLEELPRTRTEGETINYMRQSLTSRYPVFGIKNPSCLVNLNRFDIVSGFVPDSMHLISLGIAEQFASYWIDSSNMMYSLSSNDIIRIDNIIKNIKVPNQITRLSRGIKERRWWKAREWENWILYYSIPTLSEFPHMLNYIKHWALLVEGFYILNQNNINREHLNRAHELFKEFVIQTEMYYSQSAMTYNIHQLLHLTQSVIDWGPLWAHSGYCFENGNGKLLKKIHAAKGLIHQICRSVSMNQAEAILREHLDTKPHSAVHSYISYLDKADDTFPVHLNGTRYFGPNQPTKQRWRNQLQLSEETRSYSKIVKNNCLYISYKRQRLRSDNSFSITHDSRYVRLKEFIVDEVTHNEYVLCNIVNVENIFNDFPIKKIVNISHDVISLRTENISKISVFVTSESNQYICAVPNLYHY